jgi:hypothetical protein
MCVCTVTLELAVFGIEGAASLDTNAFLKENVTYSFGSPVNGNVTVEVRPAVATPNGCFFMRAKMNQ